MPSMITIQTKDGRIIHGMNYTINTTTLPKTVAGMAAAMQGQMPYGVYHIYTPSGWQYIPASNIASVIQAKAGAQT